MSKRCKLQKEFYKEFGNYKGEGKYSDYYVKWLEDTIIEWIPTPTTEEVNKFLNENYPTKTHYITTEEIDERIYLNDYPEEI